MGLGTRLWAAGYDRLNGAAERGWLGRMRDRLLARARGDVLEIGGGTGANLGHYTGVGHVTVTEPDAEMRARLERRLAGVGLEVELFGASAEDLPFPDASFDTVVSTLVLCTVGDSDRTVREIRRVLRPGGRFLFLEHGGASGSLGRWQHRLDPVWSKAARGCHLTRNVEHLLSEHGFELHDVERREPRRTAFLKPFTMGVAT
ncbi:MAG: methyltransferase domain-containing protein [Acidimicrobiia bacterium]